MIDINMCNKRRSSLWNFDASKRVSTVLIFLLTIIAVVVSGAEQATVTTDLQAMTYLSRYGYLSAGLSTSENDNMIDKNTFKEAISEFQSFAGLNVTGVMNNETLHTMSLPRCGVKDKIKFPSNSRSKRYALQGSRWRVKNLTYNILKYPSNSRMTESEVDEEIRRAFNVWTDYTNLTFTQVKSGPVHIEIKFEKGEHGDKDPFDGKKGTLAHAFFPIYGGDVHFDDAEKWTLKSYRGSNLFQVATHEFGHSLGLRHSDVKSAVMSPFYHDYDTNFQLDPDDIAGIQAIYGKQSLNDFSNFPLTQDSHKICNDTKFDVIFNNNEKIYVFKGRNYYKLSTEGIVTGYPKLIAKTWPGLPEYIDTAYTYPFNARTYFFKGSKYWRYKDKKLDNGYPKNISEHFPGIPNDIDCVLTIPTSRSLTFFRGSKYWRFDPLKKPPISSKYPKQISSYYKGIPNNIDSVFHKNGFTYFFKNEVYYRFNYATNEVDFADPAFPRSTAFWFFDCKSAPNGTIRAE